MPKLGWRYSVVDRRSAAAREAQVVGRVLDAGDVLVVGDVEDFREELQAETLQAVLVDVEVEVLAEANIRLGGLGTVVLVAADVVDAARGAAGAVGAAHAARRSAPGSR